MQVTVPVYQRKRGGFVEWTTLGLGGLTKKRRGAQVPKLQQQLVDELRHAFESATPDALRAFELKKGTHLRRVRVEVTVRDGEKKKKLTGLVPVVVEPRVLGPDRVLEIGYHPLRQEEWFPIDAAQSLAEAATAWFQKAWAALDAETASDLFTDGKDLVRSVSFSAKPKSLLDAIAGKRKGIWDDLKNDPAQKAKTARGAKVLPTLGVDRSARRSADDASPGTPRSPYREQLQMLLGGAERRSTLVVGPPGVGKSTLIAQLVDDLLVLDDFPSHRNLDRVTHVWQVEGKRIIAGMSYVGDWEARVSELLDEVRGKRVVLYVPDVHAFGRIGQARDSTRSLADVLRGPVSRGEVVILGECTETQLARLEQDAPSFASLFARVNVREASQDETFRILLATARAVELEREIAFDPMALRTLLELGAALSPQRALPGKVLELLRGIAEIRTGTVNVDAVIAYLSARTGLPATILGKETPILREEVVADLQKRVIGQDAAIGDAADLILRIRAGLVDPRRPYGVFLFTGPTGTGKTELAKAIASYLYGSEARLLRFDMGELGGPDAASRLVGDRWSPEGLLTQAVKEQPFSVVLFDEVEKAHPSVLNLFLQLFDEGRLTDAAGETASFTHAVVIMTSNLGARAQALVGFATSDGARTAILQEVSRAVRDFFPPELFNRIDRVVPFAPLSHEVAIEVAQKELGKLLSRRGLVNRHVFVQANRAVVERVAALAFEQRDGARSLKRFLEDRIGSSIGEKLAESPGAALRVLHVFASEGEEDFRIVQEALVEATPIEQRSSLEPLLSLGLDELQGHVRATVPELETIEESQELAILAEKIREALDAHRVPDRCSSEGAIDDVHRLDDLRARVRSLRDRVEAELVTSREHQHAALERKLDESAVHEVVRKNDWMRRMRFRLLEDSVLVDGPRATSARDLLVLLAEVQFLRHALARVHDPGLHGALVEIAPLTPWAPSATGLLSPLVEAYLSVLAPRKREAARGELDGWALLREDGRIEEGHAAAALRTILAKTGGSSGGARVVLVVLRAVGLCIRDLLDDETGTHVLRGSIAPPDLARVRVLPAEPGTSARALAEEHAKVRAAFASAISIDGASPTGPAALLPIVRTILRDPPPAGRGHAPTPWTIEDYRSAWVDTVHARTLGEALAPLLLLRLSREERS